MSDITLLPRSFVVSIHDVSPLTQEATEAMLGELGEWGVAVTSLLVVPDHHHKGNFSENAGFCRWLEEKVSKGHEAVVHGYFHERPVKKSDSAWGRLVTGFYTAGEGEFYDLGRKEAYERLMQARKEFDAAHIPTSGFIAPAWLLGMEAEVAVKDAGFDYTTRIGSVMDMRSGEVIPSQSLVYSVRSGWRRKTSLLWNGLLFSRLKENPLMRLGLHPPDYRYPEIWKQIHRLVTQALADREAMTYHTWMERWKAQA
ncbi:MAG: polysaccharide deacetylase family protein [Chthoniobacterales bacterium]